MKRTALRDIVGLFTLTRILMVMITYFGYVIFVSPKYSDIPVDLNSLATSWNHWDSANYVRIAEFGYQLHSDVAFFPLFPLLIRILARPLGPMAYLPVGMIISNAALLGAMLVLYQLAVECGGDQVGRRTLLYLVSFPTALFFFSAYNESLYILLVTCTFLALRRQRWLIAGCCGMLAALTRNTGILLTVPFLYELWLARESLLISKRKLLFSLPSILLIPLGTGLYALYCWHIRGDPLAFAAVQSSWGRGLSWPWAGIWHALVELFWNQPFGTDNEAQIILDLSATIAFITLLIVGRHRVRPSYTLWAGVVMGASLIDPSIYRANSLVSTERFVLELFPAFITLAILGIRYPRLHKTLTLVFPAMLGLLSILFVMYRWLV